MSTAAIEAYKARIASFVEGKDPIAVQRETPHTLAELVAGIPEEKLHVRPIARQVVGGGVARAFCGC